MRKMNAETVNVVDVTNFEGSHRVVRQSAMLNMYGPHLHDVYGNRAQCGTVFLM